MALMPLGGSVTYGGLLLRPEAHQEFHRIALLKLGQPGFSQDAFDFWFQRPEFPLIALCKLRDHFSPSSRLAQSDASSISRYSWGARNPRIGLVAMVRQPARDHAVEPVVLRAHLAGGQWKRTLTAATSAARVPWVHASVAGVNPEASRAYRLREWGLSIGDLMPQ